MTTYIKNPDIHLLIRNTRQGNIISIAGIDITHHHFRGDAIKEIETIYHAVWTVDYYESTICMPTQTFIPWLDIGILPSHGEEELF